MHVVDVARVVVVRGEAQSTRRKWLGGAMWWLPIKMALTLAGLYTSESEALQAMALPRHAGVGCVDDDD